MVFMVPRYALREHLIEMIQYTIYLAYTLSVAEDSISLLEMRL